MKAQVESNHHHHHSSVLGGKVHKSKHHKEEENEEIKAYLTKLQELVPFMPKNRKLSKLEVITHVIDYIRDLRHTLGLPNHCPRMSTCIDMDPMELMSQVTSPHLSLASNGTSDSNNNTSESTTTSSMSSPNSLHLISSSQPRQPLCVISPANSNNSTSCSSQEIENKSSSDADTRPLSC